MRSLQELLDFPPAPKLNVYGRLDRKKATPAEIRGEELFFGKANCAVCHRPDGKGAGPVKPLDGSPVVQLVGSYTQVDVTSHLLIT